MSYFNIEKFVETSESIERRSNANEMCFTCPFCEADGKFYVNRSTLKYFCQVCNSGGGPRKDLSNNIRLVPPATLQLIRVPPGYIELMPQPKNIFHSLIREKPLIRNLLRDKNFRWEDLQGWELGYCTHGAFEDRLVILVHFNGRLVALQARTLNNAKPKYKNRAGSGVYAQIFYNWDRAKHYNHIVIVEGLFDAMRVGFNAIATMGTALSTYRVDLINRLHPKRITLVFDPDRAGKRGMYQASRKIFPTIDVCNVTLPKEKDPADMNREVLLKLIAEAQKVTLAQLF